MDPRAAWGVIAFALVATSFVLYQAVASRTARDALRVVGMGCATFVLGVVVTSLMLVEAFRRLATIDDPAVKTEILSRFIDRVTPPGNAGLVAGIAIVVVGAWLRANASEKTK